MLRGPTHLAWKYDHSNVSTQSDSSRIAIVAGHANFSIRSLFYIYLKVTSPWASIAVLPLFEV